VFSKEIKTPGILLVIPIYFFNDHQRGYAHNKSTQETSRDPDAIQVKPEVIQFRAGFDERNPLDELVREGAQKMLQTALEAEVSTA